MKLKQIPLIIMLIGGAASSLISVLNKVDSTTMLKRLLITLVVFLILGEVIKIIVEKNFKSLWEEPVEEQSDELEESDQPEEPEDDEENEGLSQPSNIDTEDQ